MFLTSRKEGTKSNSRRSNTHNRSLVSPWEVELDESWKLSELDLRLPQQNALQLVITINHVLVVRILQESEQMSTKVDENLRRGIE